MDPGSQSLSKRHKNPETTFRHGNMIRGNESVHSIVPAPARHFTKGQMSTQKRLERDTPLPKISFRLLSCKTMFFCFIQAWISVCGKGDEHVGNGEGGIYEFFPQRASGLTFSFWTQKVIRDVATELFHWLGDVSIPLHIKR